MIKDAENLKPLSDIDLLLRLYQDILEQRQKRFENREAQLTRQQISLADFASGHEYFGLHFENHQWIFREWAPYATGIYFIGDMTDWQENAAFALRRINDEGVWELRLDAEQLRHQEHYKLKILWNGGEGERIPAYARRVVQDPDTRIFSAQVWRPTVPYQWQAESPRFKEGEGLLIYEVHVGMAQEEGRVGSYTEFVEYTLPRIVRAGYNTIQLMAIQEHPYYGSFGYHVANFFAASSRFGTPEELKALVDAAHAKGLKVIMDIVHSHGVSNEAEGLSRFDGTLYQYFHDGPRGFHTAWDSRCFDYGKIQVLHFLLSNCRFWLDEYRLDGFRFDGITSMLYLHHGLGVDFRFYDQYFNDQVDEDAITYLTLANKVIHEVRPDAIVIAEDISGIPGLAYPISGGGIGFDYRFDMGVPDMWKKLLRDMPDEDWHTGYMWYELTNRRKEEKRISYAESHDQAIVGDKTVIHWLMDADIYTHMRLEDDNLRVSRGIALHKLIRLITLTTAGHGYLNFMGNEFGHPEWIDFPREGNHWSYHYARRQWHLADDPNLKYRFLAQFDRDMIDMAKRFQILGSSQPRLLYEDSENQVIIFERASLIFAFNFHPHASHSDYQFEAPAGEYQMILDSDAAEYGGNNRLTPNQHHFTLRKEQQHLLSLYLPTRSALVLKGIRDSQAIG